ncbi:unannotated protein [freshwater metagenome]|uniref:Unannotated protein n=1 Tax=freshwater metagenome TaxID=449393 RepID=A0A6J7FUW0_9ZZZZ
MTKQAPFGTHDRSGERKCLWCRRTLPAPARTGRPRLYCRQSCRQQDYEARLRATELQLGDNELVVARVQIDELRDAAHVLAYAVDDTERDLAAAPNPTKSELLEMLTWLLEAARPVRDLCR